MAEKPVTALKVGYSRISDQQQSTSDPLGTATIELEKAGAEKVLVEVGSGRDDSARPQFRKLREMILDGEVSEVLSLLEVILQEVQEGDIIVIFDGFKNSLCKKYCSFIIIVEKFTIGFSKSCFTFKIFFVIDKINLNSFFWN